MREKVGQIFQTEVLVYDDIGGCQKKKTINPSLTSDQIQTQSKTFPFSKVVIGSKRTPWRIDYGPRWLGATPQRIHNNSNTLFHDVTVPWKKERKKKKCIQRPRVWLADLREEEKKSCKKNPFHCETCTEVRPQLISWIKKEEKKDFCITFLLLLLLWIDQRKLPSRFWGNGTVGTRVKAPPL